MDATEATDGPQQWPSQPITSSPFRSPAPPLVTTFEGVLSTAASSALPELSDLDNSEVTQTKVTKNTAISTENSNAEKNESSTEDLEESGSSTSSSKRSRARRRKKALYAKIRDQIAYYFSDANLRHDRFMRSLAGVEEEILMKQRNDNTQHNQEKEKPHKNKKRKFDEEITGISVENNDNKNSNFAEMAVIAENDCHETANNKDNKKLKSDPRAEQNNSPVFCELQSTDHLSGCRPVPCSAFLAFNKVANLLSNKSNNGQQKEDEDIYRAFLYEQEWTAYGTALLFDPKSRTIARREPFSNDNFSEVNDRVVYVEGFISNQNLELVQKAAAFASESSPVNENADNECQENDTDIYNFLKETFEKHGTVMSIRTPRFKGTRQLMGFAFVEFAEKEAVERAVKYFKKLSKNEKIDIVLKKMTVNDENKSETASELSDTSSYKSKESPSKTKLKSDDDSSKQGVKRKQNNFESIIINEPSMLSETKQKKVKSVQFEIELTIDDKNEKRTKVEKTKEEIKNDIAKLTTPKKNIFDINQLRVLSKKSWNQYKNRYLKLQRSVAPQSNCFAANTDNQCEDLLVSFDLARKQQQLKKNKVSNSILKRTDQTNKKFSFSTDTETSPSKVHGTSTSHSNIVQLVLQTNKAQAIESGRIRRSLRTFFETASSSKVANANNSDLPPLPSASDIAFIDCEHGIHFQTDGSMQLTAFIRTHTADSAAKLVLNDGDESDDENKNGDTEPATLSTTKNFRQLLNVYLGNNVTAKKVVLLDKTAIDNYWALVNQSKGKNSYNNCNYNYQANSKQKYRNGRK